MFVHERRRLTGLAYRLTGSWTDAEDVTQDAFARWFALDTDVRSAIRSPEAWLTTVVGRLCLDLLRSVRARRERYVGEWLPEPLPHEVASALVVGDASDPAEQAVRDESLSIAFLTMLESMTPAERVAFVLHDVFAFSFTEIAGILERSPAAARQLASSARRRLRADGPPVAATADHTDVVRRLRLAWESGDIGELVGILDPDVTLVADGGGLVGAALRPIHGAEAVARYVAAVSAQAPGLELREQSVNGLPGLVAERAGVAATVAAFEVAGGRVVRIWAVRNPGKLRLWGAA
ncbi:RNA polymerase sigma factor SigJ [Microbacterium sp. NEAU-LLC]|uniref:RNA polymerase sigma factor SigJ n=1 Tax=Microbacterium helvum TaxID=2773713 RepID=A0ABR8NRJ0_9MICO|nr:RNA polymerase sigma factor SigJ [Microbacterium helvum]